MAQSKQLTAFYQAYSDWVNADAIKGKPFFRSFGLCASLHDLFDTTLAATISKEMCKQFADAGIHEGYPFNDGMRNFYHQEHYDETMHLNPKRIAWVKSHLNQGENNV